MARAGTGRGRAATPERAARAAVRRACGELAAAAGAVIVAGVGASGRAAAALAAGAAEAAPEARIVAFGVRGARDAAGVVDDGAVLALALRSPITLAGGAPEHVGTFARVLRHQPARPVLLLGQHGLTPAVLGAFTAGAGTTQVVGGSLAAGGWSRRSPAPLPPRRTSWGSASTAACGWVVRPPSPCAASVP